MKNRTQAEYLTQFEGKRGAIRRKGVFSRNKVCVRKMKILSEGFFLPTIGYGTKDLMVLGGLVNPYICLDFFRAF